ncbi:MAG: HD domain-containing protein [Oscillospiraceae bacterium]|nr:HD domain-containing protein [Oscillospiraceae bacterium]
MLNDKIISDETYLSYICDLLNEQTFKLKGFTHHKYTTRFQHCLNVSYYNYLICRFLKLDARAAARAGLLHDFYFYTRAEFNLDTTGKKHFKSHPAIALKNASDCFDVNKKEADIILNHMWPVTIRLPKYKESFVIVFVDKFCAVMERLKRI